MLNNAIDHSRGTRVDVRWYLNENFIAFEVADDGVGAFRNMAETRSLESEFDAIGELSKGKQTTLPQAHSGLGIYFTSRMVDRLVLSSGHFSWIVDRRRDDVAVEWFEIARHGTLARCEIDADTTLTQVEVFDDFAPPSRPGANRSRLRVSLFERGPNFVSRTEAKRLAAELDSFDEVDIDFSGVAQVGQGFIDETFPGVAVSAPQYPSRRDAHQPRGRCSLEDNARTLRKDETASEVSDEKDRASAETELTFLVPSRRGERWHVVSAV